jgi:hypothetical protein
MKLGGLLAAAGEQDEQEEPVLALHGPEISM